MGGENARIFYEVLSARFRPALTAMRDGLFYARQTGTEAWQFALEQAQLGSRGLSNSDMRWLLRTGLVAAGNEITGPADSSRRFQPLSNMRIESSTCFVLTKKGLVVLDNLARPETRSLDEGAHNGHPKAPVAVPRKDSQNPNSTPVPNWDTNKRELSFHGRVIKKFKWRAANQERVLAAFQEEGWPPAIDDPLPPSHNVDPKRRLHDTIKCLNRNHSLRLVRFHGDGTGEGVLWSTS